MTYDLNTPSIARLWPHEPDWSSGFRVRRSFLTDVAGPSRSGFEQRRALRDIPRMAVEYSAALNGSELRGATQALRAAQNRPAVVPDFSRFVRTTALSSGGSSTLTIASPPAWVAEGRQVILCAGSGVFEVAIVASVAGSTITLSAPLSAAWASGSIVRPGLFGLLAPSLRERQHTGAASEFSVRFNVYPGGEPPEDEGTEGTLFNGLEVLTMEPNWQRNPTRDWLFPVEQVDFGVGRTAQFRPIDRAQGLLEAEFTGISAASAAAIEQFYLRRKGMRGAFYRSTCRPDMALNADVTGTTIVVAGSAIASDFGAFDFSEGEYAIEIVKTDGTRLRRLVTDIGASGGNSAVTLSSSVTVTVAGTARISWLPKVRFASDDLVTNWLTPQIATVTAAFQTVRA